MKRIVLLFALASLYACHQPATVQQETSDAASVPVVAATSPTPSPDSSVPVLPEENEPGEAIGISGDFNGDGVIDSAWRELVRQSPDPDEPHIFAVRFNTPAIPGMENIQNRFRLINEGDLNGDGYPEISLFQSPLHGTVHYMTTWTLTPAGWKRIAGPWMVPTAGEYLDDKALQSRIVLENDTLYYWQEDVEDDNFTLRKHVLQLQK